MIASAMYLFLKEVFRAISVRYGCVQNEICVSQPFGWRLRWDPGENQPLLGWRRSIGGVSHLYSIFACKLKYRSRLPSKVGSMGSVDAVLEFALRVVSNIENIDPQPFLAGIFVGSCALCVVWAYAGAFCLLSDIARLTINDDEEIPGSGIDPSKMKAEWVSRSMRHSR